MNVTIFPRNDIPLPSQLIKTILNFNYSFLNIDLVILNPSAFLLFSKIHPLNLIHNEPEMF